MMSDNFFFCFTSVISGCMTLENEACIRRQNVQQKIPVTGENIPEE
jgi:hypothetical protein